MPAHDALPYLREILLFLTLAGLLIPTLQRFRVNPVFGFLLLGVVVGPHGLGALSQQWPWLAYVSVPRAEGVAALAELGVLFLLFSIGLEISFERLLALKRWIFATGGAQWLACALPLGTVAHLAGAPSEAAILIGLALGLSSTAVVMPLLLERRALGTELGRASFSILLFQDLAVVPLLILVGFIASPQVSGMGWAVGLALLKAVLTIGAILLIGRVLIRPLFRYLAPVRSPDTFTALVLLTAIGVGSLTYAAGLSMALGAFLAGLVLAETAYRHEVEITIEPFRGLLLGLFFLSVGMSVDLNVLVAEPWAVALALFGLIAIKTLCNALVLRLSGMSVGASVEGGLLLSQAGEFAFIVVGAALGLGVLSRDSADLVLLVTALSLLATPGLALLGERIGRGWRVGPTNAVGPSAAAELEQHVVVLGYGRVGQLVAEVLAGQGMRFVAIDADAERVSRLHAGGHPVYLGDAGHPELLRRLGVERAAAVVLTIDRPATALHCLAGVRALSHRVPVIARARDLEHAAQLATSGASVTVPEAMEAALQVARATLEAVGIEDAAAARVVALERERRCSDMPTCVERP
jgi:CPA2 family monovalent cation:H+ antiporter-2